MKRVFSVSFFFICVISSLVFAGTLDDIKQRGYFTWGADAGGGAPYVFPDSHDQTKLIGFEVDIANAFAKILGVEARHAQNSWDSLIPSLERKDFDIAMNGIEITTARKQRVLFSKPYYVYAEQLVVKRDETKINSVDDLSGKKVGTLSGTVAQLILQNIGGVDVKIYPGQVEPYKDLEIGRIDAVLLDFPIAIYYAKPNHNLRFQGKLIGEGLYAIAFRKNDIKFRDKIDEILDNMIRTGELKAIYKKWGLWNKTQENFFSNSSDFIRLKDISEKNVSIPIYKFLPELLKGAAITIGVSIGSMFLAVCIGLFLSLIRLYGPKSLATFAISYVELYRGTPLLIQLYILYYGFPNIGITLSPLVVAFVGLGMNYAAYEAEIYRGGIQSIPKGQMEAAISLGMTRFLAIKKIILPQAIKITLPSVTNDFIALFKDSSLVSVIAMVELTKTYSILATSTMKFFELGIIVAILYFGMSYPLSLFARKLEKKLRG